MWKKQPYHLPMKRHRLQKLKTREDPLWEGISIWYLKWKGRLWGYAYSSSYRERKAYEHTVEVSVYVHEDEKGKGYGRVLMDELEKQLKEKGAVIAIAVISSGNESSSRAFTKMGYIFSGHLPKVGYKFGTWYGIDHYYKIL